MTSIFKKIVQYINIYRLIVGIGFIIAMVLVLVPPVQMPDPDDWAYYYGVKNFSEGHYIVDTQTVYEQYWDAGQQGGWLLQYLHIDHDTWVLEKAPGSVFYLVPFAKMGIPRWGNVVLALGMVIVTFILLKRLRDEKTAMIGSLLVLFTPIQLIMCNRVYMDTYSSLALLAMGGGLYILYHLERAKLTAIKGGVLLFFAIFLIGWSVIARYTNLPIAVVFGLHWIITRIIDWRKGEGAGIKREILPIIFGIGLPLITILLYDYYVFGSPFTTGYSFSPYPTKFGFQYLGQVDAGGVSIPGQILQYNIQGAIRNWFIGFPLLVVGIPAFLVILYQKCADFFKWRKLEGRWSGLHPEMPWNIFLLLIGWFIAVFLLYLNYEWTAGLQQGGGFVLFNRFYLPGLFPIVIIGALIMARFPYKVLVPALGIIIVFGALLYAQWAWNLHVLPEFLTARILDTLWPGYIFPPWTEAGIQFYPWPPPP